MAHTGSHWSGQDLIVYVEHFVLPWTRSVLYQGRPFDRSQIMWHRYRLRSYFLELDINVGPNQPWEMSTKKIKINGNGGSRVMIQTC